MVRKGRGWNPFEEFDRARRRMTRMFGEGFVPFWEEGGSREPLSDIWEDEDSVHVEIEMPGVEKEDIELNIDEEQLEIKAEAKREEKEIEEGYRRYERRYSGFYRAIPLPASVKTDKAKAKYENGMLKITLPKKEEAKKKKAHIEIE